MSKLKMPPAKKLSLDWPNWLKHEKNQRYSYIAIHSIPNNFYSSQIFPLCSQILEQEGVVSLFFHSKTPGLSEISALKRKASRFGFNLYRDAHCSRDQALHFSLKKPEKLSSVIVKSSSGYESQTRALFKRVFGDAISEEYWRWKYPSNIENQSMIAIYNSTVVAHYGILSRTASIDGMSFPVAQVGDVMVDNSHRGRLTSSSFMRVTSMTIQQMQSKFFPPSCSPDFVFGFGFPHKRHMRLASRLSLYHDAGDVNLVRFNRNTSDIDSSCRLHEQIDKRFENRWDESWKRMQSSMEGRVLLDRTWLYFLRRYWHHPEKTYQYVTTSEAVFVISKFDDGVYRIIDFIGDIDTLAEAAQKLMVFLDVNQVIMWVIDWFSTNYECELVSYKASLALMYQPEGDYKQYQSLPWWISMGDTDFM